MSSFNIETQEQREWCWAAVTASIVNYFDPAQALNQCSVASKTIGRKCCPQVTACDIPMFLHQALDEYSSEVKYQGQLGPLSWEELRQEIDDGFPVCVEVAWTKESSAHFVIIRGYATSQSGERWVDIADPFYLDSTLPYHQFVHGYLNDGVWHYTYKVKNVKEL